MKWSTLVNGLITAAMSKLEGGEKHPAWKILDDTRGEVTQWQGVIEAENRETSATPLDSSPALDVEALSDDSLLSLRAHVTAEYYARGLHSDPTIGEARKVLERMNAALRSLPAPAPKPTDARPMKLPEAVLRAWQSLFVDVAAYIQSKEDIRSHAAITDGHRLYTRVVERIAYLTDKINDATHPAEPLPEVKP